MKKSIKFRIFNTLCFVLFFVLNTPAQKDAQIKKLQKKLERKIIKHGEKHTSTADIYYELGLAYSKEGSYVKALKPLKEALQIRLKFLSEKSEIIANSYHQLGVVHYKQRLYLEALIHLKKALGIRKEIYNGKSKDIALSYHWIGKIYYVLGYYKKTILYEQKALQTYSELRYGPTSKMYALPANSYETLGKACYKIHDYDKALQYFQQAVDIRKETYGERHTHTAVSHHWIGLTYYQMEIYEKALNSFQKALQIRMQTYGKKHTKTVESNFYVGKVYYKIEKFNKALRYLDKALDTPIEYLGEKLNVSYFWIARGYLNKGKQIENQADLQKDLKMFEILYGENHTNTANCYEMIGHVLYEASNFQESISQLKKSLNIRLKLQGENHINTANTYSRLGNIYQFTNNYSEAFNHHKKALEIQLKLLGRKHKDTAKSYHLIGSIYLHIGDFIRAIEYYNKAIEIEIELDGEVHPRLSFNYNGLGNVYSYKGDYKLAMQYYKKALQITVAEKGEKSTNAAIHYYNIASLYIKKGDYDLASINLAKAFAIYREQLVERKLPMAMINWQVGKLMINQKNYKKAEKHLINSIEYFSDVFKEEHNVIIENKVYLAFNYEYLENFKSADSLWKEIITKTNTQININYSFLSDEKKLLYLDFVRERFDKYYHFAFNHGNEDAKSRVVDLLINTKSQILNHSISTKKIIKHINDKQLDSLVYFLNLTNGKIAKAELLFSEEREVNYLNLDSLLIDKENCTIQILEHPELKEKLNTQKVTWKDIQKKLNEDELLIDFFSYSDRNDSKRVYMAMLISKDIRQPVFIPLSSSEPVVDLLKTKDNFPIYLQYKEARQEMYAHLWQALEPHLKNIKTIHLAPVASLNKIDFESLQNEDGKYLADLYNFHYYTSSKDFYKQKPSKQIYKDANLYGHIAYYKDDAQQYEAEEDSFAMRLFRDTLVALPATLPEVKAIEKICTKHKVSPTLLTINEAKEDTIEYFSANRAPSIMHFATHGAYLPPLHKKEETVEIASLSGQDRFRAADNPLQRSMLMLSKAGDTWKSSEPNIVTENDGILTALEVTNLDLSNTELVVLSACNSGIGSQHTTEGVFGLPRAFKLAGVDKILVSLWPVEDETTKELMILFYTNLLQHKQDAAIALRNAKAEMRKRDDRPKKWAGFVLVE